MDCQAAYKYPYNEYGDFVMKTDETEIMEEFRQLSRRVRQLPLDVQMSIITSMRCNLEAVAFSVILKMSKKDELFKYEERFKQ